MIGDILIVLAQPLIYLYKELRFRFYHAPVFHRFLNHKYSYYTRLPRPLKMKFLRVARDNYEYFEFVPRERLQLTRGMKAIISAAAAQLLLFLPNTGLSFYKRIIIYPDFYNSRITHKLHKGEVNPGLRTIVFSWRGIEEGLHRKDDGLNLLLHEFAHGLWLEHKLTSEDYQVLSRRRIMEFEEYATLEMPRLEADKNHFFRKYAFENIEEFFAVATENFLNDLPGFKRRNLNFTLF